VPAKKERPMFIVGPGAYTRPDGAAVLALAARAAEALGVVKEGWNGFNVLHTAAAGVAGLDLGFVPEGNGLDIAGMLAAADHGDLDLVYLLGADEIDMSRLATAFVVYQGSHGDAGAHRADVILPSAAYTEKSATYANTEGRAQMTARASFPPGEAKEDWTILRALSELAGHTLPYDTLAALRAAMYKAAPVLGRLDAPGAAGNQNMSALQKLRGTVKDEPFRPIIQDFYLTNPIARASAIMAEMSALTKASVSAKEARIAAGIAAE
jgi:NADH-quinone oxidoreductase subunit G